jgi:hypothetical protein
VVSLLAGSGVSGFVDGVGSNAMFTNCDDIYYFGGDMYVADVSKRIRKVSTSLFQILSKSNIL